MLKEGGSADNHWQRVFSYTKPRLSATAQNSGVIQGEQLSLTGKGLSTVLRYGSSNLSLFSRLVSIDEC
jgi:hypothetical protein